MRARGQGDGRARLAASPGSNGSASTGGCSHRCNCAGCGSRSRTQRPPHVAHPQRASGASAFDGEVRRIAEPVSCRLARKHETRESYVLYILTCSGNIFFVAPGRALPSFESFLSHVAARLDRVDQEKIPSPEGGLTHAAVTLFLRQAERSASADETGFSAEILIIKRAVRAGDPWSGHLAFPGGRAEKADATLLDMAMREAEEEVGIDARHGGRVLGRLPTVRPLSTRLPPITVTPFVALAPQGAIPRLQPLEVEDAFWMPLDELIRTGRAASVRWETIEGVREFPAFPSPRGRIWGITERILSSFIALMDGRLVGRPEGS
jgi:8-oxo-dGTP pyrophosphatase MutT (NUDIX family)